MQLTTILALLVSCLVLFASVDYTNSSPPQGKHSINRQNSFINPRENAGFRSGHPLKYGRRQFASQAIAEQLKQRRNRLQKNL